MARISIHKYDKIYEYYLRRLEKESSKKNLEYVLRFKDACFLNNMSKPRVIRYFKFFVFLFSFFDKNLATVVNSEKMIK